MACGCCRRKEKVVDEGPKNGMVPRSGRKCRDCLCCVFFIVYWIGMAVVAIVGIKSGKPMSLVYGHDYNGNLCGDGAFADKKFLAFPRLDDDMMDAATHVVSLTKMKFFGVCVSACPQMGQRTCTYDNSTCWMAAMETKNVFFRCVPIETQNSTVLDEKCIDPPTAQPNCTLDRFLTRKCSEVCKTKSVLSNVWEVQATSPNPLMDQLQGYLQVLMRFLNDMNAASGIILAVGGVGAMVFGIIWLIILQLFAGVVVALTCLLVMLALMLASLFCSVRADIIPASTLKGLSFLNAIDLTKYVPTADDSNKEQFKYAAIALWVVTGVVFLLLVAMQKRIRIAIAIIRESSRAIRKMPSLLLWPLLPTILFIVLVVYAVYVAACIMSSDDLKAAAKASVETAISTAMDTAKIASNITSSNVTVSAVDANATAESFNVAVSQVSNKTLQQILLVFHIFGFLWTNQLIQAISICTIAGAVAQYYWTAPDEHGKRKMESHVPVLRSLGFTLRFHLGSLCFGSFIIAFVQLLRLIMEYIDHNTKQLQQSNKMVKVALMGIKCCLWCFEKCLKFLSKNAYIIIAMKGSSFCSAAVEAFKIILSNLARVAVVNSISFFLLLLVKVTISLGAGMVVFVVLSHSDQLQLGELSPKPVTSALAPVLATCILAWLVASAFTNVYDGAIDTILVCFCEDTQMNGENASPFMSNELKHIMGGADSPNKHKVVQVSKRTSKAGNEEGGDKAPEGGGSAKVHAES
ncbi:TPA: hypothetical protein N0F65_006814 [Lagenidium giganteum]|uniref:Choline transporter-like protein n=1 Tax=Lagenidium giganteum TaxID=4803 RepID=A0AAV2ZHB5_9STRA|nr:TPA: hypothetical protein N0F65_006814 [Lagenidium giganteum]